MNSVKVNDEIINQQQTLMSIVGLENTVSQSVLFIDDYHSAVMSFCIPDQLSCMSDAFVCNFNDNKIGFFSS